MTWLGGLQPGSAAWWTRFILCALATWRISHLIALEDGPWELIARMRRRLGAFMAGKLMDCFGCVSMWVAAPMSWLVQRQSPDYFLCWLALSAAAFLLERLQPAPLFIQPVPEGKEEAHDGMLR